MRVLLVVTHPREKSLTLAIAQACREGLQAAGHQVELADLDREGFDPSLPPQDEPDWDNAGKRYSDLVLREQARIERNEAIVLVFPIWWWSLPARMKGWIDRVWNNGWAYGSAKLKLKKGLMIGIGSGSPDGYKKRGYDSAMDVQLRIGIMDYCGIADSKLELFLNSMDGDEARAALFQRARQLGKDF